MTKSSRFFLPLSTLSQVTESLAVPDGDQFIRDFLRLTKLSVKIDGDWEDFNTRQPLAQEIFLKKVREKNHPLASLLESQLHQAGRFYAGRIVLEMISLAPFGMALINSKGAPSEFAIEVSQDTLIVTEMLRYDELQFRPISEFANKVEVFKDNLGLTEKTAPWKWEGLSTSEKEKLKEAREYFLQAYSSSSDLEFYDCDGSSLKENQLGERSLVLEEEITIKVVHQARWDSSKKQLILIPIQEEDIEFKGKGVIEKLFVDVFSQLARPEEDNRKFQVLLKRETMFPVADFYGFKNLNFSNKIQGNAYTCAAIFIQLLKKLVVSLVLSFSYTADILASEQRSSWYSHNTLIK